MDMEAAATVFNRALTNRLPLESSGGGTTISNTTQTAISVAKANLFGYLLVLEAICIVVATTAGTWTLRDRNAGDTLRILQQPDAIAPVGTRYVWCFPHPFKTGNHAASPTGQNASYTIQNSVNTMGTWVWHVNGFYSST